VTCRQGNRALCVYVSWVVLVLVLVVMVMDESDDGGRRYGLVMRALCVSAAFYEYRAGLGSREKHALTPGVVVKAR